MAEVLAPENQSYFSSQQSIRRSTPSPTFHIGSPTVFANELQQKLNSPSTPSAGVIIPQRASRSSSASPSANSSHADLHNPRSPVSTPSTSYTSGTPDCDDEIVFPSYTDDSSSAQSDEDLDRPSSPEDGPSSREQGMGRLETPSNTPELFLLSVDDTEVRHQPVRQVDYLSHEWREQDLWSSWRYIVSHRKDYGDRSRLENACWRTWAKQKHKLKTVTPETLNWLKDCDVTWLYGPLQTSTALRTSEPVSQISKSNSFLNKKPILKKRSMSEVMHQRSLSTSSLIKQAAAAVKAQENIQGSRARSRPYLNGRAASDFVTSRTPSKTVSRDATDWLSSNSTSGHQTPADGEKKHIRFDEKVEQCIAVDVKEDDEDIDDRNSLTAIKEDEESSSDDGVIMMKADRRKSLSRSNSRGSFSGESKTIAKLPSTTLKYRTDSPDISNPPSHSVNTNFWRPPKLSPSPSQETIRPANPSTNFLLPDASEDEDDALWEPAGAFSNRVDSLEQLDRQYSRSDSGDAHDSFSESVMRRTPSGMFMPFEDEEERAVNAGIIGRVMDGVNTARDIAHVIWNVGWRGSQ